jgi:hypothetical protein
MGEETGDAHSLSRRRIKMAKISGRLNMELRQDGSVTITFVPNMGGGNMSPLIAKNIDVAEDDFIRTFGQTPARAAAIRNDLGQERAVNVEISVDVELAATLCVPLEPNILDAFSNGTTGGSTTPLVMIRWPR